MLTQRHLGQIQGGYYFLTGVWPIIARESFQHVTGFKVDFWIAQLVGALLALVGSILFLTARRGPLSRELRYLAAGSAIILGVFDLICVPLPHTTRVYWLDAIAELMLLMGWIRVWREPTP